jgi:hypothetical protein
VSTPRVVVVFNKWWELDPALAVLTSAYVRGSTTLGWPELIDHPRPRRNPGTPGAPGVGSPRAVFSPPYARIEIWCISDLLEHLPDKSKWQSSSERKAERIPSIFADDQVACCIAVGTAASGTLDSRNGSVVIGTQCFLHNAKPGGANPDSNWQAGPFDRVLSSTLTQSQFAALTSLDSPLRPEASLRLLPPPLAPSLCPSFLADFTAVAVGSLNVTDYRDYDATDKETLDAFAAASARAVLGSLETTHGLIRSLGVDRFLFVSGIVDRLLHFNEDVGPRTYAQNTVGAHNTGVALAFLLPRLEQVIA